MENQDNSPSASDDRDGSALDPSEDTFEDWIEHLADAEGVPAKAVRARLMSSYWILDEISRHLEGASFEDLSDEFADEQFTTTGDGDDRERIRAVLEELVEETGSLEPQEPVERENPSWEALVELVESLDGLGQGAELDRPVEDQDMAQLRRTPDQLDTEVRDLREQLDSLQHRWNDRYDEVWKQFDELEGTMERSVQAGELDALEEEFAGQLSELESSRRTLEATIDDLVQRMDATVSDQADEFDAIDQYLTAHADRIETVEENTSAFTEKLQTLHSHVRNHRDRIDQAESTIDGHTDQVEDLRQAVSDHSEDLQRAEEVFRHLFRETDRLDQRLSDVGRVVGELEPVILAHQQQEQVASLKQEAAEIGRQTAQCETCGETVDLGLLTEPACPHCATPAEAVTQRSGFIQSQTVLESSEDAAASEQLPDWTDGLDDLAPSRDDSITE
jgi:chromosome segregation ATPase